MARAYSGLSPSLLLLWLGCLGCAPPVAPAGKAHQASNARKVVLSDAMVQYSLIAALADGDYTQGTPLRQVLADGDFGIGTFDNLAGEMILLDGQMYQALADGTVRAADLASSTPFAAVTFFTPDGQIEELAAASLEDLDEQLDRKLPRRNSPYALRIEAEFADLTLRSVPTQKPPFMPLVEVVKHQTTWQTGKIRGTLIGFRCPHWVGTLNVPGYHWHFLSDDHKTGGHVLNCQFSSGDLHYDECSSLAIRLPESDEFDSFNIDKVKKQDINTIERQRETPPK